MSAATTPSILIAGNPNSGKSTLFNALSGGSAHVGNYPGVTVDRTTASVRLGQSSVELVDVPGSYSLTASSPEEQIAVDALITSQPEAVVCVVDATTLQRGLYFALQLIESGDNVVVALNMMDAAERLGVRIDTEAMSERLGVPVVPVVATKKRGLDELRTTVADQLEGRQAAQSPQIAYSSAIEADLERLVPAVSSWLPDASGPRVRSVALWSLLSLGEDSLEGVPAAVRETVGEVRRQAESAGRNVDLEIIGARYQWIEAQVAAASTEPPRSRTMSERIDAVLTHPVSGIAVFAVVMFLIFEALFAWADPAIGVIEDLTAFLQSGAAGLLPEGVFQDMIVEGVIAGVGNVVVFAPQILMLFLFIGFLEDSGYLARVAFVIDRVMKGVGLHGKAFVPLLSGFACAIPAVMATRTIERKRDRLVTMLALPLMSCSARLPVYILVVGTVFAGATLWIFSAGAIALFAMYTLSVLFTLLAAAIIRRTVLQGPTPSFVLELPPYRWPSARTLWLSAWRRLKIFLVDAGTIILAMTVILWVLLSFPKSDAITTQYDTERAMVQESSIPLEDKAAAIASLDSQEASAQLQYSAAGRFGHFIEPVLRPIGFDWQIGVGIIGAFAAREVFVSTLGVVFGIGDADEENRPLREALRDARHADGTPVMTPLSGVSLMLFFLLACQCMSTLAVVRRESGSWKWPVFLFTYMSVLAYTVSFLVYQGGKLLGFS